jgi:hypothetical protein
LFLDFIVPWFKLVSNSLKILTSWEVIVGKPATPPGVEANKGLATVIHAFKLITNLLNKTVVLFPNNKGSVASFEPNLIEGAPTTKLALVSKLNPLTALNPIVWAELNKI